MDKSPVNWYVYIIRTTDSRLYTGITTDVTRRVKEHSSDSARGAKFFRGTKPESLMFLLQVENRSIASKKEIEIKKLKRSDKIKLIASQENEITGFINEIV